MFVTRGAELRDVSLLRHMPNVEVIAFRYVTVYQLRCGVIYVVITYSYTLTIVEPVSDRSARCTYYT